MTWRSRNPVFYEDMFIGRMAFYAAALWRDERLGVPIAPAVYALFDTETTADGYYNGRCDNPWYPEWRQTLPPGRDKSWIRGTWAAVPITWHCTDRASNLKSECIAARERETTTTKRRPHQ